MYVCLSNGKAMFRTPFSETHDLLQMFRGVGEFPLYKNAPVDFMCAGLMQKNKWDDWHMDVPFSVTTDESPALYINDVPMGGNHGQPDVVEQYVPRHGKTVADIGSLWEDESGMLWTLLRIVTPDHLDFISENIGESETAYAFCGHIQGALQYVSHGKNTKTIPAAEEQSKVFLCSALSDRSLSVFGYLGGKKKRISLSMTCDYAEIHEGYTIINPATVADALRKMRPEDGFVAPQSLAVGKPMFRHDAVYRIENDGTVLYTFHDRKLTDINFQRQLGIMFQEKVDAFGGGVHRYIPKTLPFKTPEGAFDFRKPYPLAADVPYPKSKYITAEYWETPDSPPDRIVDVFRDAEGKNRLGYVGGFLPVYDGEPLVRRRSLSNCAYLYVSRKAYPTFMDGSLTEMRGVAYKKYFSPMRDHTVLYTVPYMDKLYIFVDIFKGESATVPVNGSVTLLEKSDAVSYTLENNLLTVSGENGYAVFVCA